MNPFQAFASFLLGPIKLLLKLVKQILLFLPQLWLWLQSAWQWFTSLPVWLMAVVTAFGGLFIGGIYLSFKFIVWFFGYVLNGILDFIHYGTLAIIDYFGDLLVTAVEVADIDLSEYYTGAELATLITKMEFVGHIANWELVGATAGICITLCLVSAFWKFVLKLIPGVG